MLVCIKYIFRFPSLFFRKRNLCKTKNMMSIAETEKEKFERVASSLPRQRWASHHEFVAKAVPLATVKYMRHSLSDCRYSIIHAFFFRKSAAYCTPKRAKEKIKYERQRIFLFCCSHDTTHKHSAAASFCAKKKLHERHARCCYCFHLFTFVCSFFLFFTAWLSLSSFTFCYILFPSLSLSLVTYSQHKRIICLSFCCKISRNMLQT